MNIIYYIYQLIDIILHVIFGSDITFDKTNNKIIINNIEYIKLLNKYNYKYDVDTVDSDGKTIFMKIFNKKTNWKTLKDNIIYLLQNGADINLQDYENNTALMYASLSCSTYENEIIKFMIENKADTNLKNNKGDTALMMILTSWNSRINLLTSLQYLIYSGNADINIKNNLGVTPIMQIAKISGILSKSFVLDYVINQGAHINMVDNDGNSALMYVLQNIDTTSSVYAAELLIKAGSDLEIKNNINKIAKDYITDDLQYLIEDRKPNITVTNNYITKSVIPENIINNNNNDFYILDPVNGLKISIITCLGYMLYKKFL